MQGICYGNNHEDINGKNDEDEANIDNNDDEGDDDDEYKNNNNNNDDDQYQLPNHKTTLGRRAYSYRGLEHWNSTPGDLKNITSKPNFQSEPTKSLMRDVNHPT